MHNILVVDDDTQVLKSIAKYLSACGFEVTALCSGNELKSVIFDKKFDIAIVDIILPHDTGFDIIKEIRDISPETCIFTWTGYPLVYENIDKDAHGISDCLVKPCSMRKLIELINTRLNTSN